MTTSATTTATPEQELATLLALVADMSKLALAMSHHAIHLQERIPIVVAAHVAALHAAQSVEFERGIAHTPDELEALHPPGIADFATWYAVIVGREPGIYLSSEEADSLVKGVPNQYRKKKSSRLEALAFYCLKYGQREVMKLTEVVDDEFAAAPPSSQPSQASQALSRAASLPPTSGPRNYSAMEISVIVEY
ncbi:hypothetical protein C8R46DRAFT_1038618 [Mycena filopes]|nr:hypothetical protein C8R46DRAFT_1038618 [Mycena filopes]